MAILWNRFWNTFGGLVITFGVLAAVVVIAVFCSVVLTNVACNNYANLNPTYEIKYDLINGCLIKQNGLWISTENLRGIAP